MWSLHKRSVTLYSSQMWIDCSRNAVYSLRSTEQLFKKMLKICLPFCWTTHFRHRHHSCIIRSMNFWDSEHHSSMIACFSCSTVSSQYTHCCRSPQFPHCVVWTVCFPHLRLDKGEFLLCGYLMVFGSVRWWGVLLQKHIVWIHFSYALIVNIV